MASMEAPPRPHDRHARRRPFTNWMKRLANLKSSNSYNDAQLSHNRTGVPTNTKSKKQSVLKNNPYPVSGRIDELNRRPSNGHLSFSTPLSSRSARYTLSTDSNTSLPASRDGPSQNGHRSVTPTISTNGETALSEAAFSKAGTSGTNGKTDGGRDSTFSSPAPSVRSLTTTLTTVHSAVNSNQNATTQANAQTNGQAHTSTHNYSHPFTASPPPTAVPSHLAPHSGPITYNAAVANNALTDDASILTLASSSKRRRRNSLDTNASVRALAPQSVWGGSRESLPLSLLSGNAPGEPSGSIYNAPGTLPRSTVGGLAREERTSIYSTSGAIPALASERNSYIASKPTTTGGDGASVRSGRHSRNDSISNVGITPTATNTATTTTTTTHSPLHSPNNILGGSGGGGTSGRVSRHSTGWGELRGDDSEDERESRDAQSRDGHLPTAGKVKD